MDATTTQPSLAITRRFEAPPEKVWQALTQPEALKQWMGPSDEFKCPIAEVDLRIGGRYRIAMQSPDGELHEVSGIYREVSPPQRLVYTWAWKTTPERESVVTITLRAVDGGTELTLRHERFFDAEARDHHDRGWQGCLARLERYVD